MTSSNKKRIATALFPFFIIVAGGLISVALKREAKKKTLAAEMPLIINDPFLALAEGSVPQPNRGPEFQQWLEPGVRLGFSNSGGSGTIVHYDEKTNQAYVQSCGHFFNGDMSAEEGKSRDVPVRIEVFYKNGEKLETPQAYTGKVLWYHNNKNGMDICQDVSLMVFEPDFVPDVFPIAPEGTTLKKGQELNSIGCDGLTPVAHYLVEVLGENGGQWPSLVTTKNSPRPGRSGGGLINDQKQFVAICWGTSKYDGTGNGYFTPLKTIRHFNEIEGYGWLNDVKKNDSSLLRTMPIIDRNNRQQQYSPDYVPSPLAL